MAALWFEFGPSLIIALLLAVLLFFGLRSKAHAWIWAIVFCVPVLLAGLIFFSTHSFLHYSIVSQLMLGTFPPENPLLAGETLSYAWLHHGLVALLASHLKLAPLYGFVLLNAIGLLVSMWAVYRIAILMSGERRVALLSAFFALFGVSPLLRGPFRFRLKLLTGFDPDPRIYPIVKFMTVNSNGLGLMCVSLLLLALVQLSTHTRMRHLSLLFASLLGLSFLYPIVFPVCFLITCLVLGLLYILRGRNLLSAGLAVFVAGLCSVPYLLHLKSGRVSSSSFIQLGLDATHYWRNGINLVLVLVFALPLIFVFRKKLINLYQHNRNIVLCLLSFVFLAQGYYLFFQQTDHTEYKILALSFFALAPLLASCVSELYVRSKVATFMLVWLCFVPGSSYYADRAMQGDKVADPHVMAGAWVEPLDGSERELVRWIRANLPTDAVLVDNHLSLPAFTGRPLLLGVDYRRESGELGELRDGWGIPVGDLLTENFASNPEIVRSRERTLSNLLSGNIEQSSINILLKGRKIYVLSRSKNLQQRLLNSGAFKFLVEKNTLSLLELSS